MRCDLIQHPSTHLSPVTQLAVDVIREPGGRLVLHYVVSGNIKSIKLPSHVASERADELWRHTCFEAFLRNRGSATYYEFNFSPSTKWACYHFDSYREGMAPSDNAPQPQIDTTSAEERVDLRSTLILGGLDDLGENAIWEIGLSAVIEALDGSMTYWALAHPTSKPDFHHNDCFARQIPAP